MKNNKILAIGIPSYNGEKYLDRCINTFVDEELFDKIEVIIVNDGSTDNTKEIAEKYQKLYPKMVRVINKENGGHGSAVNAALYSTNAKYYKVVDCDDWVDTEKLKELVEFLEKNNCDIVSNNYETVNMVTGETDLIATRNVKYGEIYKFSEIDAENIYMSIHSMTYRTKLLTEHNIKLQEKTFFVDVEYQLLPIPYVKTVAFLDFVVYKYMIGNVNQSVDMNNFIRRYSDHDRVVKRILDFLDTAKLSENQEKYVSNVFTKVLYTHYSLGYFYDDDKERGIKRSLELDAYLKEKNNEYYEKMGRIYPILREARKNNFELIEKKSLKNSIYNTLRTIKRILFN